jgi:16S rRNA (uracil1498-N3)-methyltransferase
MASRRFYASPESFAGGRVILGTDETRHLRDVLRLKAGDRISVFDGAGHEFDCSIAAIDKRSAAAEVIGEIDAPSPESPIEINLAAAILKGDKFDLVVQKAVELGMTSLIPLYTVRCEAKQGSDPSKRLERWSRIAIEATKQCGRSVIMPVREPVDLMEYLRAATGRILMFSERGGQPLLKTTESRLTSIIGPEGGWDDSELEAARAVSAEIVTLGGRVLRAETAAISIAAILQFEFGDLKGVDQ